MFVPIESALSRSLKSTLVGPDDDSQEADRVRARHWV